ncbi:hypothetical protein [Microvirga sp. P5_D2]
MAQTRQSRLVGEFACMFCGALYEVTIKHQPERDKDYERCECCGQVMAEWNDTTIPSFKLIEASKHGRKG